MQMARLIRLTMRSSTYSTDLYTNIMMYQIKKFHSDGKPLFMYLSKQIFISFSPSVIPVCNELKILEQHDAAPPKGECYSYIMSKTLKVILVMVVTFGSALESLTSIICS